MERLLLDTSSQFTDLALNSTDDLCEEETEQAMLSDGFVLPPTINTAGFEAQRKEIEKKFAHGTTTLGFVFNRGIVIAVDSRASMGQYICTYSAAVGSADVVVFFSRQVREQRY